MGNSPDMALMDYCVSGIFKWELFDHSPSTVKGLKRIMTLVWNSLDQGVIKRALRSWPDRVKLMLKKSGGHVEHILSNGK